MNFLPLDIINIKAIILYILLAFLFAVSASAMSQRLPFKDCSSDSCQQQQFESLMKKAETFLYEKTGFAYNDSVAITLVQKKGKIKFLEFHAWVNPEAKFAYRKIIKENSALLELKDKVPYTMYWTQKVNVPTTTVDSMASLPMVNQCRTYSLEAKKGCYRYLYAGYLAGLLQKAKFFDWISADFVFKGGKLTGINFINPPQRQKEAIDLGPIFLSIQERVRIPSNYTADSTYTIHFDYYGGIDSNTPEVDEDLTQYYWEYYTSNKLWAPLKNVLKTVATSNDEKVLQLDTNLSGLKKNPKFLDYHPNRAKLISNSAFNFLEKQRRETNSEMEWFKLLIPEQNPEEERIVDIAYPGCDTTAAYKEQILCFNRSLQRFVSRNFEYPEAARMGLIQGRFLVYFTIAKNGTIYGLNVLSPAPEVLAYASIKTMSELPKIIRFGRNENEYENIVFTMPFNLQLQ